jgi:hypothetical protein
MSALFTLSIMAKIKTVTLYWAIVRRFLRGEAVTYTNSQKRKNEEKIRFFNFSTLAAVDGQRRRGGRRGEHRTSLAIVSVDP